MLQHPSPPPLPAHHRDLPPHQPPPSPSHLNHSPFELQVGPILSFDFPSFSWNTCETAAPTYGRLVHEQNATLAACDVVWTAAESSGEELRCSSALSTEQYERGDHMIHDPLCSRKYDDPDSSCLPDCVSELPSLSDIACTLLECKKQKNLHHAVQLYSRICDIGLDAQLGNYIVPLHVECGNVHLAQQAFYRLSNPNQQSWASMLSGFLQSGCFQEALNVYIVIKEKGVQLRTSLLVSLLQACSLLRDVQRGREIQIEIILKGHESYLPIYNTLIFMYAKCCLLTEAHSVFEMAPERDVISWTALILGYAENGLFKDALKCLHEMQSAGVSPNMITYSCVLKACSSTGLLENGREVHNEIALKGLLDYPSVSNSLVSMYVKCGSLSEAYYVLRMQPVQDLASWTILLQGYIEHGSIEDALKCFDEMQREGVCLDAVAFACSLRACSSIRAIDKGRDIHKCILLKGLENDLLINNALIAMYAKCGAVSEAHVIFNNMSSQNSISWTALITGYAENGPGEEALACFALMQMQGLVPTVVTLSSILKACGNINALGKGREIHSYIVQHGLEEDHLISSGLVNLYASCGELAEAENVFNGIRVPDVVLWTVLISGYVEHGLGYEALFCFGEMQLEGVVPDLAAFTCFLKGCVNVGAIGKGRQIHAMLVEKGLDEEISIGNSLVAMYASCGSLSEAQKVFNLLEVPDVMSWTSLIAGYAEHGYSKEAIKLFEEIPAEGIFMDAIIFTCVLKACGNLGALQKGREIHALVIEEELEKHMSVTNSLINMYIKCGAMVDAADVFDHMLVRDSVSWGSMLNGYCMMHDGNAAIKCFEGMQEAGVKPDAVTFTCLLNACSHASLISEGIAYYKQMRVQYDVEPTIEHHTCIIDLLGRSGKLYEAENLLLLYRSNEATWSALLTACRTFGEPELGLRCFQELITINAEDATWYVLMADILMNAGCGLHAYHIEELRKYAGAKKKSATAMIEVNNELHEFSVGSVEVDDISRVLNYLNSYTMEGGHMPNLDRVLKPISDDEKETMLCEHAEKVAIAFGLLNTSQGTTLRVTKNLRMCNDCHDTAKIISRIERREIILRDTSCMHNFKDGKCTCGDLY